MSKIDEVRAEMVKAMKNGDKARKDVLSLLLSDLKAKWVDKHADLTEEEENTVIQKEIKQTKETMETSPKDRTDIIEQSKFALSVLEEFAPKGLSEDEIAALLQNVLAELGIAKAVPQDRGRIMKALMPQVKGRADGSVVSRMVADICSKA
ncbi:MAG TPA: GatB/YqeY domain-containing protein [Caproicibacter sp.]|nr:GatB/YqeY domain-containing protein [Caproicibacter sp.]